MVGKEPWARVVLAWADGELALTLVGEGAPDLSVVDGLARLQLVARRAGVSMALEDVAPGLMRLLELTGLPPEVGGEAEGREDPLHVQE